MSEYVTIQHYVNHVMDEITKRDVEQVSERLRALGLEEVVRCRDCKCYKPWVLSRPENGGDCVLNKVEVDVPPDGFCAWGERRKDAES